jgi:hypothetical protein
MIAKLIAEIITLKKQVDTSVPDNYTEALRKMKLKDLKVLRDSYQEEIKTQSSWFDFV